MTRPAVAQQLSRLEEEVGETLTFRDGRRTSLTASGKVLLSYANRMLSLESETESALASMRTGDAGQLRVGGFGTAVFGLVPPLLRHFAAPTIELTVEEMSHQESLKALAARRLDLAIVDDYSFPQEPLDPSLAVDLLFEDDLFLALPRDHALAHRERLALEELRNELWILNEGSRGWFQENMTALRSRGFEPRLMHGSRSFSTSLALVAAGAGVSIQPGLAFTHRATDVSVVPIEPRLHRRVLVAHRRGTEGQPLLQRALRELRVIARSSLMQL